MKVARIPSPPVHCARAHRRLQSGHVSLRKLNRFTRVHARASDRERGRSGWRSNGVVGIGGPRRRPVVAAASMDKIDMSSAESLLGSAAILTAVIVVHELGHFVAARLQKIKVTQVSLGFGPTLLSYTPSPAKGEEQGEGVKYCINLFPFGGYVSFPDPASASDDSPGGGKRADTDGGEAALGAAERASGRRRWGVIGIGRDDDRGGDARTRMRPMSEDERERESRNFLKNRPILDQFIVSVAGVVTNMCVAFALVFATVQGVGVVSNDELPGVRVRI